MALVARTAIVLPSRTGTPDPTTDPPVPVEAETARWRRRPRRGRTSRTGAPPRSGCPTSSGPSRTAGGSSGPLHPRPGAVGRNRRDDLSEATPGLIPLGRRSDRLMPLGRRSGAGWPRPAGGRTALDRPRHPPVAELPLGRRSVRPIPLPNGLPDAVAVVHRSTGRRAGCSPRPPPSRPPATRRADGAADDDGTAARRSLARPAARPQPLTPAGSVGGG